MGFSLTWVAARGKTRDRVLADLGLQETDAWEEVPESPVTGAQFPGGWYGVIFNRESTSVFESDTLKRLSTGAEVVVCSVEEHVMYSAAWGWKSGQELWSVIRDSEENREGVTVTGKLPREFSAIEKELRAKQQAEDAMDAKVDYLFAIPVELAKALTGYRHDEELPGVTGAPFEVLAGRKKAGKWFARWAG